VLGREKKKTRKVGRNKRDTDSEKEKDIKNKIF